MLKQAGNGMHVNAIGAIIVLTLLLAPDLGRCKADATSADFSRARQTLKRLRSGWVNT